MCQAFGGVSVGLSAMPIGLNLSFAVLPSRPGRILRGPFAPSADHSQPLSERRGPGMGRECHPRTGPFLCPSCCAFSILAHVSRKVTVRLKTSASGEESTVSTQK